MENHRTKFRGELKSSLKDDGLAPGGEDLAPGGEDLARKGNRCGRERARGKLQWEGENTGEAHGIEKEGKGPTNRLRNRRVRRLIGSTTLFLALELGAGCDAKLVLFLFFPFIHVRFC